MNNITLFEAARLLLTYDDYFVVIHEHPDGDALGSGTALCLALRALGKKAELLSADPPSKSLMALASVQLYDLSLPLPAQGRYITVDVADSHLCGKLWEKMCGNVLLKIDHHLSSADFARYNYTDPEASAAGEVVYELLELLDVHSTAISEALYLAIASDTGGFRFSNTTAHTMEIVAKLYRDSIDAATVNRLIFESKPMKTVRATAYGITRAVFRKDDQVALVTFSREELEREGFERAHLSEIVSALRAIDGVELAIVLKPSFDEEGKFDISARSKQFFDCSAFCECFGGGGHLRAGGGAVYAADCDSALAAIEKEIDRLWK